MKVRLDPGGMKKIQADATKKLNEAWLAEVQAVAESHGSASRDEIKAELARRFADLSNGGTLTDDQLDSEAQNIIDHH